MSLIWTILSHGLRQPNQTAVVDDFRSYTYAQVLGASMVAAEKIESTTDKANVGILLPTSGGFAVAMLGVWLTEKTCVPLNYLLKPHELAYIIQDADLDTVVTSQKFLDYLGGPEVLPPTVQNIIRLEQLDYSGWPPLRWPPIFNHKQRAAILYTSGTSGLPKGVILTHRNIAADVRAVAQRVKVGSDAAFLGVLPQFHSFGFTGLTVLPLFLGGKVIYQARFTPRRIIEALKEHRPSVMLAVPSMWGALLSVKSARAEDFTSLVFAVSGGEPLSDAVFEGLRDRFHITLLEGYGLTETAPVTHFSAPWAFKRGSVGPPIPCVQALIVDENLQPLPTDAEGELLIKGENVMDGYLNRYEETQAAFVDVYFREEEEWVSHRYFRTGDIARIDEEGFLFITGRKKEMMVVGGENVFPRTVEAAIEKHPAVAAVGVCGLSDPIRGEVPIAFVELAEDAQATEEDIRAKCREELANYMVPREVHIVKELPRNAMNKVLRRKLLELRPEPAKA